MAEHYNFRTVVKIMENIENRMPEDGAKDFENIGARFNLLYFGDDSFQDRIRELNMLKRAVRDREESKKQELEQQQKNFADFGFLQAFQNRFGLDQMELEPDREEVFLN